MAFQLSPGINVSELDITTSIPAVATTTGAIAGVFAWGPMNEPILINSETDLVKRFHKPGQDFNQETFFTTADFLAYASMFVTRCDNGATQAAANTVATNTVGLTAVKAKYAGTLGNSLNVQIIGQEAYETNPSAFSRYVNRAPSNTSVHVIVTDSTGQFSGTSNTVIEVFENVSVINGAKTEDGTNNFVIDVINAKSNYINVVANTTFTANAALTAAVMSNTSISAQLSGAIAGNNESTVALSALQDAYDVYASPDSIDVSLIMTGKSANTDLVNYLIDNVAEVRKDCIVFVSPNRESVVNNNVDALTDVIAFAESIHSSSYAVIDSGYKYRYDRYNDTYIYTPLNGDVAGLCARTDETRDPWFSPAGYNRGTIKNIVKLSWNPNKAQRDELYKVSVNPVITQTGQGTILFGDKTALKTSSAFDRINVRRLFIVLEKAIIRASQSTLFEFNDEFTRAQFKNLIEPFLRNVQGRRGIYDFKVVCDETNNTPEVIDSNRFVGDIYVKPARAINYLQLNFVAVRTGVEFNEIVGVR